jgi:flagellin-like protein
MGGSVKAISPVIATVIIVAVTVAVAIAVALWMTGLVGGFTGTENLQIITAYANAVPGGTGWNVILQVKNAGTTTATIDQIFINDIPYTSVSVSATTPQITITSGASTIPSFAPTSLTPGTNITITIFIPKGTGTPLSFTSGQQVEIKLHSASGKTYPIQVVLP